jgi:DNA modification methylase
MQIENLSLDKIIPYVRNPRKNNDAIEGVSSSIKEFGFQNPIIIDSNNVIVAGHTRHAAAKKLGLETAPCVRAENLTEAQVRAYRLLDNKLAEKSSWDSEMLSFELADLGDMDIDMSVFDVDFSDDYETEINTEDDEVPAAPKEAFSKLGDVWLCGRHRVMCGDSLSNNSFFSLSDATITDPPYGIDEETDRVARSSNRLAKGGRYNKIIGDQDKNVAKEICKTIIEKDCVIFGANHFCHGLPESASWLVWDKRVEDKEKDFNSDCELAFVKGSGNSVRIFRHKWKGLIKDSENGEARCHPTQKPIALICWSIEQLKKQPAIIYDPFLGSGTTLIAAERLNRTCYGMELEPRYVDVICQRFYNETKQVPVRESDQTPFPVELDNE